VSNKMYRVVVLCLIFGSRRLNFFGPSKVDFFLGFLFGSFV